MKISECRFFSCEKEWIKIHTKSFNSNLIIASLPRWKLIGSSYNLGFANITISIFVKEKVSIYNGIEGGFQIW